MRLFSFIRDQRGGVLITTGLGILFLIGVAGAAIDLGNQQLVRARTQQSSDAAALAAGSLMPTGGDPQQVALRYFNLNFSSEYMGIQRPSPTILVGSRTISVSASNTLTTMFAGTIGSTQTDAGGRTVVAIDQSASKKVSQSYDVLLVMDNSGSMMIGDAGNGQSRIGAVKQAALTMSGNMLGDGSDSQMGGVKWDTRVIGQQSLTSSRSTMDAFLNSMAAMGGTNSTVGMQAAQSLANSFRSSSVHAVVLLTDGQNNSPSYNQSTDKICDDFKNSKTIVYTVAFGQAVMSDNNVHNFLSKCASPNPKGGSYFYIAPDAPTLEKAFATITESIRSLRITD